MLKTNIEHMKGLNGTRESFTRYVYYCTMTQQGCNLYLICMKIPLWFKPIQI